MQSDGTKYSRPWDKYLRTEISGQINIFPDKRFRIKDPHGPHNCKQYSPDSYGKELSHLSKRYQPTDGCCHSDPGESGGVYPISAAGIALKTEIASVEE